MRKRFFSKLAIVMSTALAVSGCFCPIDKAFVNAETIQDEDDSYYDDDSDYDDSYDDSTDDSYDDSTDDSYDDSTDDSDNEETTGTKIDDIKLSSSELQAFVKESDSDENGYISQSEAEKITYVSISKKASQSDLTQIIKLYPNISELMWNAGTLTKLTFPKNNIKRLNITSKAASQLVISGINQKLNNLSYTAQGSKKYAFNFAKGSAYKKVEDFNLMGKQINGVKLSNAEVGTLYVTDTSAKKIDASSDKIINLWVQNNKKLSSFTVRNCSKLKSVSCAYNALSRLNISGCPKLLSVSCDRNKLTKLDISKYKNLKSISCGQNKLKKFDISKNKKLISVYCNDNKLTELNTSKNKKLSYFGCSNNKLNKLNVMPNKKLTTLSCYGNKFTKVNLKKNKELVSMAVSKTYKLMSSYIPTASKSNTNYIYIDVKKGTKLNLVKYAPALKKAKFRIGEDSQYITVNKKGVVSIKKKKDYVYGYVIAILNKKEYNIRIMGF